jgi:hypothetical protein
VKGLHVCNTVKPHPFVEDPDDAWKLDAERECAYCTRFPRDWEHKIRGRYRRVAMEDGE